MQGKKKVAPKERDVLEEELGMFRFQSSRGTMCSAEARIFLGDQEFMSGLALPYLITGPTALW